MPPTRRRRGYVEPLPSGRFRAVVYLGTDPLTGKRRNLTETVDTAALADKALTKLQRQADEDQHPKSAITLTELIGRWLAVADLEETTRDRYQDLIRLYVTPTLGSTQVSRLDPERLETLYARLERCRHLCGNRPPKGHTCVPLSSSTTRKIHYIIRGALERALRWRYVSVNVATLAEAPSPKRTHPDPPSAAEAAALLNDSWTDPEWGLVVWLTMVTGCRRGELCALRWRDLDVERSSLWVSRSTSQPRSGIKEKATKTEGQRRIGIDSETLRLLAEHRTRVEALQRQLDVPLTDDAFLFSSSPDYSTPMAPRSVSQRYRRMATRLGLRSTRLHSLRHYSATELLAAGVDLRTVAGRLGHGGGGATTLKVYAAWVDEADRKAADTIAKILPTPAPTPRQPRGPYMKIADALRADIREGRLRPGDQLPTVVQLAGQFTVAAGTAHRALSTLSTEGWIEVSRGKRAVVVDRSSRYS
jgi:integrase